MALTPVRSLLLLLALVEARAPACSQGSSPADPEPRASGSSSGKASKRPRQRQRANEPCPRSPALDDPSLRVDLPLPEHAFARCDFTVYGPTEASSQAQYEQLATCADPPGRPSIDFASQRVVAVRTAAPSQLLGATREPDGSILVHVLRPGICSGADWGDEVHVVVLPNDGSAAEVDICVEPSTCAPGEMPA